MSKDKKKKNTNKNTNKGNPRSAGGDKYGLENEAALLKGKGKKLISNLKKGDIKAIGKQYVAGDIPLTVPSTFKPQIKKLKKSKQQTNRNNKRP